MRVPFTRTFGQPQVQARDRMADEPPMRRSTTMHPVEPIEDPDHQPAEWEVEDQLFAETKAMEIATAKTRQAIADGTHKGFPPPGDEPKGKL